MLQLSMTNEETVQSIIPLLKPHFVEKAKKFFHEDIKDITFTATQTYEKIGASGKVLISTVYYETKYGENSDIIAMKFFQNTVGAISEIKNALELEIKFMANPEFAIPKVIFASTKNPVLIIYEGVTAINYDETDSIPNKSRSAGRLLATIHGTEVKPVDSLLYRDLSRMIGTHLASTGMEKDISEGLGYQYQKLEGAYSGCNPFGDFHQSNVMISSFNGDINKLYIIDPEFMQAGSFDRLEDVGTFFGHQLYEEYTKYNSIEKGLNDINEFLSGYQHKNIENGGVEWHNMYPNGCPLAFFIAQWALMDTLDIMMNRGGDIKSESTINRLNFVKFILQMKEEFQFPKVF